MGRRRTKAEKTVPAADGKRIPLTSYITGKQAAEMVLRGLTPGVDPIPDDLLLPIQREDKDAK
jgi:hypothetical protein